MPVVVESRGAATPFFSICIPQHNRTQYLLYGLERLASQTCRDFEVCISDDHSSDGQLWRVERRLEELELPFALLKREVNGRYDVNLRCAISLARGKYVLLMGNDDCLAGDDTIEMLRRQVQMAGDVGAVIANYSDYASGGLVKRVFVTEAVPGGPEVASRVFRNFSFVSGIGLRTSLAQQLSTDRHDGSEMYQMYLGCRILAAGHALLQVRESAVLKDVRINGQGASIAPPRVRPDGLRPKVIPILSRFGRTAYEGISPFATDRSSLAVKIFWQLYVFTFPFFIFDFRRTQSWRYAAGACLGLRPAITLEQLELRLGHIQLIRLIYATSAVVSLALPVRCFTLLRGLLHRFAKLTTRVPHSCSLESRSSQTARS